MDGLALDSVRSVSGVRFEPAPADGGIGSIGVDAESSSRPHATLVKGVVGVATTLTLISSPGQGEAARPSHATVNEVLDLADTEGQTADSNVRLDCLRTAMAHPGRTPHRMAVSAASDLLTRLVGHLMPPQRVVVARSGNVVLTYFRDRRYASLECDEDGDVVLTLADRSTGDEPDADVVTRAQPSVLVNRIRSFLER